MKVAPNSVQNNNGQNIPDKKRMVNTGPIIIAYFKTLRTGDADLRF